MQIHDVEQNSDEWFKVRLGIPTASRFKDILTSTGKPASGATSYRHSLIAERIAGKPLESFQSDWMQRGTELEPMARERYEMDTFTTLERVGFITNDEGTAGCSPDGLEVVDGSVVLGTEFKCPAHYTHIKYMLGGMCPAEYYPQVQGSIWLCELDSWDFMSYHPDLPPFLVRVHRDDVWLAKFGDALNEFNEKLHNEMERLAA